MSELERVKAALEAHGWSWHGANGTASGKRDMLLSASRVGWAAGAYETAIHSRDTLMEAIEATEQELRQLAAEMLVRADELAAVRWSVKREECARTNLYALGCAELQRRTDAGLEDDETDRLRERLARMWYEFTGEERQRIQDELDAETPSPSGK